MRRDWPSESGTNALGAHVAVVLRHLVLEDQVVAEGVPGQLAADPVILVQVGALVGEDDVGREICLQLFEVLDPLPS